MKKKRYKIEATFFRFIKVQINDNFKKKTQVKLITFQPGPFTWAQRKHFVLIIVDVALNFFFIYIKM